MRFGSTSNRPLVLLHSVEYSAMTPWQFCLDAQQNGFQIILIRRPGYGRSTPCDKYEDQLPLVDEALSALELEDAHLHATGSGGFLGWQLFQTSDRVTSATFCNYAFGPVTDFEHERVTESIRQTVKQAISSELGCKLLLLGLNAMNKSGEKQKYIKNFFGNSTADLEFLKDHETESFETFDILTNLSARTLRNDIRQLSVLTEPMSSAAAQKPFQFLIGGDAPEKFRDVCKARAEERGGTIIETEKYDYFVGLADFFENVSI